MLGFGKQKVSDEQQAQGALSEMAALDRKIAAITLEHNAAIAIAKKTALEAATPLLAKRKELHDALKKWATLNKTLLFAKRKTIEYAFGIIGFRSSPAAIQQMRGISEADSIEKMQEFHYDNGIRTVLEVNKEAMNEWSDEKLAQVGLERKVKTSFVCEPKHEKITAKQ